MSLIRLSRQRRCAQQQCNCQHPPHPAHPFLPGSPNSLNPFSDAKAASNSKVEGQEPTARGCGSFGGEPWHCSSPEPWGGDAPASCCPGNSRAATHDPTAQLARPIPKAPQVIASFSGRVWSFPGTDLPQNPFVFFPLNGAAKQEMRLFFHLRLGRDIFSLQNTPRWGMGSQR